MQVKNWKEAEKARGSELKAFSEDYQILEYWGNGVEYDGPRKLNEQPQVPGVVQAGGRVWERHSRWTNKGMGLQEVWFEPRLATGE